MARKVIGCIVEELTDWITETHCREDLKHLITEDGVWKAFVEAAELSSEEEAALRDALKEHLARAPTDEIDGPQRELQKKRFIEEFPQLKSKLEEHIRKLRALADHFDQVHKGCTISNVVSSSVGTASGVLGILGLALAPFTGGASLLLSATSVGLGATAKVNGVTTSIVEESIKLSDESEARRLVGASNDTLFRIVKIMPKMTVKLSNACVNIREDIATLRRQIRAIRMARAGSRQVGSALSSSAHTVTRAARIREAGFASIFLALDLYHLVTDSVDLYNGATTESARALRDLANSLQEQLQEFEQIYRICCQT